VLLSKKAKSAKKLLNSTLSLSIQKLCSQQPLVEKALTKFPAIVIF